MSSAKSGSTLIKKEPKKESKTPNAASKIPMSSDNPTSGSAPKKSGCCMGTAECPTPSGAQSLHKPTSSHSNAEEHNLNSPKGPKTRIVVKYDVGFNNLITIRGKGAGLNWDRGLSLKNTQNDEWVWETETPFTTGEFKVLINDTQYELGDNHTLRCGAAIQYTPKF